MRRMPRTAIPLLVGVVAFLCGASVASSVAVEWPRDAFTPVILFVLATGALVGALIVRSGRDLKRLPLASTSAVMAGPLLPVAVAVASAFGWWPSGPQVLAVLGVAAALLIWGTARLGVVATVPALAAGWLIALGVTGASYLQGAEAHASLSPFCFTDGGPGRVGAFGCDVRMIVAGMVVVLGIQALALGISAVIREYATTYR
jgi:hypothetical protein